MFGSPKRHVFKPTAYGTTRRPRRIPRWLVLLLTGVVLGAGGLLFLQKSYGPTRLTVEQSEQLHYDLNSANMDKQRLQSELSRETRSLADVRAQLDAQTAELKAALAQVEKTNQDIQLFADAMPADPRGTSPGIRAASFTREGEELNYQILVMQDQGKTAPFKGSAELTVAGRYNNGKSGHIDLPAFDLELERYTHAAGSEPLPPGFSPREVTIKIKREGAERVVATRTIRVAR
ncbi:hypothetical protein RE432_19210 [Pusillimonas sp. SM2304]|uniref:hypothetical protein n=1 Tax=Pusillimonas sp. SM2304 TaxID=3073241 RepID=UPI0028763BAA|nr:hypothetical protein [Pusillimonas sp. SM2304]MDS1142566.1 hypothetical protein [Pusillimonas sp. SM2304]